MYIQIIIFRNNEIFCHKERIDQKMLDGQCVYGDWIAGRDIADAGCGQECLHGEYARY